MDPIIVQCDRCNADIDVSGWMDESSAAAGTFTCASTIDEETGALVECEAP